MVKTVNSFGMDKGGVGVSFAQLLTLVSSIDGLDRLRFTTSHPKDIASEVISAFGELENLCPSLHLPMQAGSDHVLKAMRRKYDMKRYLSIVDGPARRQAGYCFDHGSDSRIPRRDRRGFPADARNG